MGWTRAHKGLDKEGVKDTQGAARFGLGSESGHSVRHAVRALRIHLMSSD